MRIYLAGPIFECTDEQAEGWRKLARLWLPGHTILDPMARDCRGHEDALARDIVLGDLAEIGCADALLVNASRPSWGTAMEIVYAYRDSKRIVAYTPGRVSPWLRYHATEVHDGLDAACKALCS